MKLIWHGHSCFTLESGQGTLVFDPYQEGSVPGLPALALEADLVLCSHGHRDHSAEESVRLTGKVPTLTVERLETFHDSQQGALRGPNTIHIVTADGMRLAHLGDLGCMPAPAASSRNRPASRIPWASSRPSCSPLWNSARSSTSATS